MQIGRASGRESGEVLEHSDSSRRRHTRCLSDWSSDVCSSDLSVLAGTGIERVTYDEQEDGLRLMHGSAYVSLVRGSYIAPSAALVSKNAVERVGFFDESLRNADRKSVG